MMKLIKFRLLVLVPFLLALNACQGQLTVHPTSQENPATVGVQKAAQNVVDEVNATIAAAAKTVKDNIVSGAFTKTEGQTYFNQLTQAAKYVDVAQSILPNDPVGANSQLNLAKGLVALVQSQLIKVKNNGK